MIDHSSNSRWSCRFQQRWWAASCAWSLAALGAAFTTSSGSPGWCTLRADVWVLQRSAALRIWTSGHPHVFIDLPVWFSAVSKVGLNSALWLMLELPLHLAGNDCPHLVLTWPVKAGLTAMCGRLAPPSALGKEVCLAGWLWRELHTVA